MQELVGRLTALDPEASEGLKVIAYFDALVDGHASTEVLLRGAAVLSGCAAGYSSSTMELSVDATGARQAVSPVSAAWPHHDVTDGARVWLGREGPAHANDAMILERLAIGLGITLERSAPIAAGRRAVDTVIDGDATTEERRAAASALRISPTTTWRVTAQPAADVTGGPHPHTVVVTPVGAIRATIVARDVTSTAARLGVGLVVGADELPKSWSSALIALRLTSARHPVVDAEGLGSMMALAEVSDTRPPTPDVAAIERLDERDQKAITTLEAIVANDSLRAAATEVGVHHSTMQARAAELSVALGYDLRTAPGRTRLSLALSLLTLSRNRFD